MLLVREPDLTVWAYEYPPLRSSQCAVRVPHYFSPGVSRVGEMQRWIRCAHHDVVEWDAQVEMQARYAGTGQHNSRTLADYVRS